jgi:hypothetical protein
MNFELTLVGFKLLWWRTHGISRVRSFFTDQVAQDRRQPRMKEHTRYYLLWPLAVRLKNGCFTGF